MTTCSETAHPISTHESHRIFITLHVIRKCLLLILIFTFTSSNPVPPSLLSHIMSSLRTPFSATTVIDVMTEGSTSTSATCNYLPNWGPQLSFIQQNVPTEGFQESLSTPYAFKMCVISLAGIGTAREAIGMSCEKKGRMMRSCSFLEFIYLVPR